MMSKNGIILCQALATIQISKPVTQFKIVKYIRDYYKKILKKILSARYSYPKKLYKIMILI
jgi:hypothetical protein